MNGERQGLELRSTATAGGELRLTLEDVPVRMPGADEVVVRVEAAPLNPSDLALLLGPVDLDTLTARNTDDRLELSGTIPTARLAGLASRIDQAMPVGNEGAGTVVEAGADVRHLIGKTVGMLGGAMYTRFRTLPSRDCIVLPEGVSAADGASMFVNPLTAQAMVETMRREGHSALIHTAAASNLGQMLNRLCLAEDVPLVSIVRSAEQVTLLREAGAIHVVDSSSPAFREALTEAIASTGATLAFDAIGGGRMANRLLHAMEAAVNRKAQGYSRYGSSTHKQVYIYGGLDTGPTEIDRGFGMAWNVGGFLLTPFLQSVGPEQVQALRDRVARELTTTFASRYTDTIGMAEALRPDIARRYARKATGEKFLIDPSR